METATAPVPFLRAYLTNPRVWFFLVILVIAFIVWRRKRCKPCAEQAAFGGRHETYDIDPGAPVFQYDAAPPTEYHPNR